MSEESTNLKKQPDLNENEESNTWAKPFFTIWIGQALSLVGSRVGGFALVWWLTQESGGSATILAMATFVAMLPAVILGPFIGALVDRWNRQRVLLVADSLIAAFSALLAILALLDVIQIWHIYVLMFVRALGGTFHFAAMRASTSLMVPKSLLSRVAGMNQTLQGIMSIITPPLGALLMEVLELYMIMGIDVLTAAFAVVPLFFITIPQPKNNGHRDTEPQTVQTLLRDVREGIVYLWKWKGMVLLLIVASLLNGFINPGFSLMPILVKNYFGGGALELGWTESAWGFGMIAGGITLSVWGGFKRKIKTSLLGLIGMGIGLTALSLVPASLFWLALISLFVGGYFNPIANGPFFAILQEVVDPSIQGRVFTVISSVSGAAAPIGVLFAGPVSDQWGVQLWFFVGGIVTLLCAVVIRVTPSMMHLEDHRYEVEPAS